MLAVIAFMIIATGGWVRISDAGESCPDWPTCFGTWGFDVSTEDQEKWWEENPDEVDSRGAGHRYTSDQIFTEWLHRGLVGIIGILVIYSHYTAWSLRNEIGEKTYKLHYLATVLLVMQAVVGYVTVDLDNAPWTVALHLFMALMFTTSLMAVGLLWWQNQAGLPDYLTAGNEKDSEYHMVHDALHTYPVNDRGLPIEWISSWRVRGRYVEWMASLSWEDYTCSHAIWYDNPICTPYLRNTDCWIAILGSPMDKG